MTLKMKLINLTLVIFIYHLVHLSGPAPSGVECTKVRNYYYTRTRKHPSHLRISEELKNQYVDEVKYESKINGTKFEYYRSTQAMNYDELVFETIDKIFRHRLSPFYIHHYDNDQDKKRSSDPRLVSHESCARDLMYLVDKLPAHKSSPSSSSPSSSSSNGHKQSQQDSYQLEDDNEQLTPELSAFFDSYARQEAGLLMGNTYWVGGYDQCISRHVFELMDSYQHQHQPHQSSSNDQFRPDTSRSQQQQGRQQHQNHQQSGGGGQTTTTTTFNGQNKQVVSFGGRYCVASLKAPSWDKIIDKKKVNHRNYFKSERQLREYSKLFRIQLGLCLPDSCDSTALERHHDEIKLLITSKSLSAESRLHDYDLIDLFCLPDESSQLRQWSSSAVNFILFIIIWLTMVLLASLADVFELFPQQQEQKQQQQQQQQVDACWEKTDAKGREMKRKRPSLLPKLVCWFSMRANYRKLMHVSSGGGGGGGGGSGSGSGSDHVSDAKSKGKSDDSAQASLETQQQQQQQQHKLADEEKEGNQCDQNNSVNKSQTQATTATSNAPSEPDVGVHLNVDLKFLNACKVLVMFWIINGHIMLLMIQTAKNILNSDAILNELFHFLIGATFGVDLFFTITGFLTCYLIFNSGHAYRMKPSTWIYLSFHRYWRLAPMYLLSFWFSRSVVQLLGSGPLWDYGTASITFRGLCNTESWWYPLTLTSNLHGLFEECMITSWYISCDMQFWLVSPIFIHLLAKSPLSGWLVSVATIVASSQLRYDALLNDKSARYDELVQPRADIFMRVSHDLPAIYTHPHYRIGAYIVGLLAGHYVYMIKSSKWTSLLTENLAQDQRRHQQQRQLHELNGREAAPLVSSTDGAKCDRLARDNKDYSDPQAGANCHADDRNHLTQYDSSSSLSSSSSSPLSSTWKQLDKSAAITQQRRRHRRAGGRTGQPLTRAQWSSRLRNVIAYTGLIMFLLMAFASYLLSNHFPSSLLKHSKPIAAALYAVDHLVMSIGASLMFVSICMGQWPALNRLMSHPNWTRLSKINYALLLLQCEAIYYQIFRYEQVPMAGTREMINILFNLLVTLYPVAFLVTLVFEYPLANIEKLLLG